MITLRELAKSDRAIGSITTDECHLIAAVLELASKSRVFRLFLPKTHRQNALAMRMLAATLGRTPAERVPKDIKIQIYQEMQADRAK